MLDFAGFFTHSRDIGFITDLRGAILASTVGAERALGYAQSELAGLDLPHLDEAGDLRRFLEQNADPHSRLHVGFHLRSKSGRILTVGSVASSLRDETGKAIGWFFACQDLRGAVAEARGSRPILDALVDSIGAALWSFDRNGTVITWGRACEAYFGVARAEAEGKLPAVRLFSSPEEFRRVLRAVDEKGLFSAEIALVSRGGAARPNHLAVTPLSSDGQAVGYTAVSFDLSERLKAEEFFRVLFQKANDAVFLVEGEGLRIVEANEAAGRLLGYSREEFLALKVPDIVPPDKRHLIAGVRQSVESPGGFRRERRFLLRKDGSTVLTDHTIKPSHPEPHITEVKDSE